MTRAEAQFKIMNRVRCGLCGSDALALQFSWACGLGGSPNESDRVQSEILSAVERALEDFRPDVPVEVKA